MTVSLGRSLGYQRHGFAEWSSFSSRNQSGSCLNGFKAVLNMDNFRFFRVFLKLSCEFHRFYGQLMLTISSQCLKTATNHQFFSVEGRYS